MFHTGPDPDYFVLLQPFIYFNIKLIKPGTGFAETIIKGFNVFREVAQWLA